MTGKPMTKEDIGQDSGASPLASGLSRAEPEVSALRASIPSAAAEALADETGIFSRMTLIRRVSPFHTHNTPFWIYEAVDAALRRERDAGLIVKIDLDRWERLASAGEAGTATTVQQGVVHEHATRQGDAQGEGHDSTT